MFNLPGQAYTLFHNDIIYNNDYHAASIDLLLEYLINQGELNPSLDTFQFIGSGFVANILLFYSTLSYFSTLILVDSINMESLFKKRSILAINPFTNVDGHLKQTLIKTSEVITETPDQIREMPLFYYNLTFGNGKINDQQALEKHSQNPITKVGALSLINGVLQSFNTSQMIAGIPCPIVVVHTSENSLVDANQTFDLCRSSKPKKHLKIKDYLTNQQEVPRLYLQSKGSYLAFDEKEPDLFKIIESFLEADADQSTLDSAINNQLIMKIEADILSLQEIELSEAKYFLDKMLDPAKSGDDSQLLIPDEMLGIVNKSNTKISIIEQGFQKIESSLSPRKTALVDLLKEQENATKSEKKVTF